MFGNIPTSESLDIALVWKVGSAMGCTGSGNVRSVVQSISPKLLVILWSESTATRGMGNQSSRTVLCGLGPRQEVKFWWLQGALALLTLVLVQLSS